jgi:hypothetical protein
MYMLLISHVAFNHNMAYFNYTRWIEKIMTQVPSQNNHNNKYKYKYIFVRGKLLL